MEVAVDKTHKQYSIIEALNIIRSCGYGNNTVYLHCDKPKCLYMLKLDVLHTHIKSFINLASSVKLDFIFHSIKMDNSSLQEFARLVWEEKTGKLGNKKLPNLDTFIACIGIEVDQYVVIKAKNKEEAESKLEKMITGKKTCYKKMKIKRNTYGEILQFQISTLQEYKDSIKLPSVLTPTIVG